MRRGRRETAASLELQEMQAHPEPRANVVHLDSLAHLDNPDCQAKLALKERRDCPAMLDSQVQMAAQVDLDLMDKLAQTVNLDLKVNPDHRDNLDRTEQLDRGVNLARGVKTDKLEHLEKRVREDQWEPRVPPDKPDLLEMLDLEVKLEDLEMLASKASVVSLDLPVNQGPRDHKVNPEHPVSRVHLVCLEKTDVQEVKVK